VVTHQILRRHIRRQDGIIADVHFIVRIYAYLYRYLHVVKKFRV
jgi:hypothetical protein